MAPGLSMTARHEENVKMNSDVAVNSGPEWSPQKHDSNNDDDIDWSDYVKAIDLWRQSIL